jgi:hypothetical protein
MWLKIIRLVLYLYFGIFSMPKIPKQKLKDITIESKIVGYALMLMINLTVWYFTIKFFVWVF